MADYASLIRPTGYGLDEPAVRWVANVKFTPTSAAGLTRRRFVSDRDTSAWVTRRETKAVAMTETVAPAPARKKGPIVWLDMDQEALDNAYDQVVYAPNQPLVHARRAAATVRARAALGEPLRLAYGSSEFEQLDVYRCKRAHA